MLGIGSNEHCIIVNTDIQSSVLADVCIFMSFVRAWEVEHFSAEIPLKSVNLSLHLPDVHEAANFNATLRFIKNIMSNGDLNR